MYTISGGFNWLYVQQFHLDQFKPLTFSQAYHASNIKLALKLRIAQQYEQRSESFITKFAHTDQKQIILKCSVATCMGQKLENYQISCNESPINLYMIYHWIVNWAYDAHCILTWKLNLHDITMGVSQ